MIFFKRIRLALFEIYPHIMDKTPTTCQHQIYLMFRHSCFEAFLTGFCRSFMMTTLKSHYTWYEFFLI